MRRARAKRTRWPVVVTLRIDGQHKAWLEAQAVDRGLTVSDVLRNLIAKASGRCK